MALNVIICDDSKFARTQLIRVIPKSLISNLYQAENGLEAMKLLRDGKGELLFLDLTMPVMDGYQVLQAIREENIDVLTIVVSGDIQLKAQKIIAQYNTLAFLKKPLDATELIEVLQKYGLVEEGEVPYVPQPQPKNYARHPVDKDNKFDELREKLNIATGIASGKIGDYLNLFVTMTLPQIHINKGSDLSAILHQWLNNDTNVITSQGFIGADILGESLIFFSENDINSYASFIGEDKATYKEKAAQILELASLISSSLTSLANQFSMTIRLTHPALVQNVEFNLTNAELKDADIMCVKMQYDIKDLKMSIRNVILFTNATTEKLKELMAFV